MKKKLVKTCQSKCKAPLKNKEKKTQNETNQVIYDHSKSCPQELNKGLMKYSTCKDERRKCFSLISCVFPTSAPLSIDPLYKHRPVFLHTTLSTKSASIQKARPTSKVQRLDIRYWSVRYFFSNLYFRFWAIAMKVGPSWQQLSWQKQKHQQ